jgi:hypothetical protein
VSYGMAFDPFPLPEIGGEGLYFQNEPTRHKIVFLAATIFYIIICAGTAVLLRKEKYSQPASNPIELQPL